MEDNAGSVTNDTVSFHYGSAVSVRNVVILKRLCLIEELSRCVTNVCSDASSLFSLNRVAMEVICKLWCVG